jgi:hypothetical protein
MLATGWRRPVSMLAGSAFAVLSCGLWLVAWLAAGFACDDTCSPEDARPGAEWTESSGAAQWTEIFGLGSALLLLALVSVVLVIVGRRRAALVAVLIHIAVSVRLGLLINTAHQDTFLLNWAILAATAGLIMVIAARAPWGEGFFPSPRPARDDTHGVGVLALAADLTGALLLGWLLNRLVANAVTIGARVEFAGNGLSDAEPIQFYSWFAAGLCVVVLVAGAIHVVTKRPSRAVLRLGGVAGALAALAVALYTASVL